MKHDEKKIEELLLKIKPKIRIREDMLKSRREEFYSLINQLWEIQKQKGQKLIKQYAEHMVAKERDRMRTELLSGEYQGDELGGIYLNDEQIDKILKMLS